MKIFVNDDFLDLEAPIQMSEDQVNKFIDFMKKMFPEIEVLPREEVTKEMGNIHRQMVEWTVDDYFALLQADSNEKVSMLTERSDMSIIMKRGSFVPDFYSWMKSKGYVAPITKEMVKEYLVEKGAM